MGFKFIDEIESLKFSFGDSINNDAIQEFNSETPLFGYDYIDLNITNYNFSQDCFDNKDLISYFKKVKELSNQTIDDLIDNTSYEDHFHFYHTPRGKLLDLLKLISGKSYFKDEELPSIGQFALYTGNNVKANRATKNKSPRIFFMLGHFGVFYILFYDPYHEIR